MPKRIDLIGQKFGNWKVLKYLAYPYYLCKCSICGKEYRVTRGNLVSGMSTGCQACSYKVRPRPGSTHNMSHTRIYTIWLHLRYRKRGVCEEWIGSFERFYADVSGEYKDNLFLVKIDKSRELCSDNFGWASQHQCSGTVFITINGKTQCMVDWAKELGISRQAFEQRLKHSDDPKRLCAQKGAGLRMSRTSKYKRLYGMSLKELGTKHGIVASTVLRRIKERGIL